MWAQLQAAERCVPRLLRVRRAGVRALAEHLADVWSAMKPTEGEKHAREDSDRDAGRGDCSNGSSSSSGVGEGVLTTGDEVIDVAVSVVYRARLEMATD